jgi:dipeptidase
MEIYTGHQYAAVRLPTDLVAGFGNEFMLDTLTGFDEVISSAALETLPAEKGFAVYNEDGTLNLFSTYSGENRLNDYGNLRTWRIHNLLAPSTAGEYDTYRKYDLLYAPDEKVSTEAVIDIFRDRFEGSSYEAQVAGGKIRILATETASQVHVQKIHHDLPPEIAVETWQCFSNANYAPFIPLPNCLSAAPEAYTYQIPRYDYDAGAAACRFKTLNALSAQDREHFGSGIEAMWQEYETIWAGKYREALEQAAALWAQGDADEARVLLNDCANQAMDQALRQADVTTTDLIWYIMQDVDTLRYTFSYETLTLSEEPYERTPFMPLVNAAEYAALNDWNCENQEEGLLLTKGDTTIRITPSDGKRTSKGSVMIGNEEPQSIVALQRDAGVYIPLDQAMQLLKSAA